MTPHPVRTKRWIPALGLIAVGAGTAACSQPYVADAGTHDAATDSADVLVADTPAALDAFDAPVVADGSTVDIVDVPTPMDMQTAPDVPPPTDVQAPPDVPMAVDMDGDGSPAGVDCNDQNASVFPGARERCNGVDDDCDGVVDDGACQLYYLPRGASSWSAFPLDAVHDANPASSSPDAPVLPVRAAMDVEVPGIAYVVTDTTYHVLDLVSRAWTSHGARDSLAPEMSGQTVITGYSVPSNWPTPSNTEGFSYQTTTNSFFYGVDINTRAWTYQTVRGTPTDWTGPDAASYSTLHWLWLDIDNAEGWVTVRPVDVCPTMSMATRITLYQGVVDATGVHIYDLGYCGRFVTHMAFTDFPPFRLPGAPRDGDIITGFYRSGLWVITR